jgi:hypothetical protein
VVSHTGAEPGQSASLRHGTHVPAATSQTGVAPAHRAALLVEHWPQRPEVWQAGVAPPQSPSPAHARQVWVASSQVGRVPPHWVSSTHDWQVPVSASHAEVAPPTQRALLVAEQTPHAPEG